MTMENKLYLPLHSKWFEMTKTGIKTEDYREINRFWISRIINQKLLPWWWSIYSLITEFEYHGNELSMIELYGKKFDVNVMTLGYPPKGDTERILQFEHKGIEIRTGNPEWGAEPDKMYFVIKHGKIIN